MNGGKQKDKETKNRCLKNQKDVEEEENLYGDL